MMKAKESLIQYRHQHGLSQKQLGLNFGVSETCIREIENGARPMPHKLRQITIAPAPKISAKASQRFNKSFSQSFKQNFGNNFEQKCDQQCCGQLSRGNAEQAVPQTAFQHTSQICSKHTRYKRDLPVLGRAQGGNDGNIIMNDAAIDWTFRPTHLEGIKDAFAVFVTGDSMNPRYKEGDLVYVHPRLAPVRDGFVLVEIDGHRGFIKQFIKWDDDYLILRQFNPEKTLRISAHTVLHVKAITGQLDQ